LKAEIVELKDEKRKETDALDSKLKQAMIEKAELSAKEQTAIERIAQLAKDKERIELENEEKMLNSKKDSQRQLAEMQTKMQSAYDEQKEVQRRQMASESEFDK
jgi:hypothetical protein